MELERVLGQGPNLVNVGGQSRGKVFQGGTQHKQRHGGINCISLLPGYNQIINHSKRMRGQI